MPLLVTSVPNLAQGVSQQPDNLRFPGQCDEQINAWATVVEGLVKRPNTEYIKNIQKTGDKSDLFTHFVKRDEKNKYVVTVSLGGIGAINLANGTNVSVAVTSIASSYLSLGTAASLGGVANPLVDLKALTVADYTFLINKNKRVTINSDSDTKSKDIRNDDGKYEALVFVKLGDYEKTYDILLDGKLIPHGGSGLASNKTPPAGHTYESGTSSSGTHADTEIIAEDLETVLNAYIGTEGTVSGTTLSGGSGFLNSGTTKTLVRLNTEQRLRYTSGWKVHTVSYEFFIDQYQTAAHNTKIGFGAKGTVIFKNGVVQSYKLTKQGNGYDGVIGTADPNTYKLTIRQHITKVEDTISDERKLETKKVSSSTKTDITSATPGILMPSFTPTVLSSGTNYEVKREGAVIKFSGTSDFSIRTEDGLANQGLGVAYKEVDSITDLPKRCFNDFRIKIRGDANISQDDYYVIFQTKDREDYGEGSWVETIGWTNDVRSAKLPEGLHTTINVDSMPVTLVPEFDSYGYVSKFFLQAPNELTNTVKNNNVIYTAVETHVSSSSNEPGTGVDWEKYWVINTEYTDAPAWVSGIDYGSKILGYASRQAGDDFTNPFPSFIGLTINDVFFFKNRLGFLTDNAVIFSEADNYFNFFRTTTQQLLDSAPIDVGLSHTKVAVLKHAIPFQEKLMLFSQNSQFVLRGADVLSPKTVAISPVTEYDISDNVNPVAVGSFIYFPFKRQQFEGLYEYFIDNNTEVFEATEITSQVPKYIPTGITHLVGSNAENLIVCRSSYEPKSLYVYKYFWQNKEKIQSAWMKFTYNRNIRGFDFIDSNLYVLTEDSNALHLEKATMESGLTDEGLDYRLLLDSRVDGSFFDGTTYLSPTYNTTTKKTTLSGVPYDPTGIELYTKTGTKREVTVVNATITEKLTNGDFSSSYIQDTSFCLEQSCGLLPNNGHANDHTFASRPLIVALQTASGLTAGTYYEVKAANTTNGGVNIWELGGASEVGWYPGTGRGTLWEVVNLVLDNWTKITGAYDLTKQASGILKRSAGTYTVVRQNVSLTANTRYKLVFNWSTTGSTASGSGSVNFGEDTTWELTGITAASHSVKKDDGDVFYFTTGDTPPTRMDMSITNDDYEWDSISLLQERSIDITGTLASYVDDGSGDYVTYNGDTYYCIKAHTSSSTFESINWRKSTTTPSGTLAWASSTSYSAGILYKCIVTHTSAEGDDLSTSSNWATTTDVNAATIWSSGRLYNDDTYFFIGLPYDMLYRFSNQILKQPTERGGRSASDYTFQTIRNASVEYADTGHFTVEVTPKYRDTYSYAFNPEIVGANLTLDVFEPKTGHFRFPVQSRPNDATIEIKSSSALPVKLLAAEFESMVSARSKRYGG